jgi:hypothetical protein
MAPTAGGQMMPMLAPESRRPQLPPLDVAPPGSARTERDSNSLGL